MTVSNVCNEQSCAEQIRKDHHLCRAHWEQSQAGIIDECPACRSFKNARYPYCIECTEANNALAVPHETTPSTVPNICQEQSCRERIRPDHYLCHAHWDRSEEGVIDPCPQCGAYKDSRHPLCIECNKKSDKAQKTRSNSLPDARQTRRYDPIRADTFSERTALLEDDQKARDKRQLFHQQQDRCIYCGNKYQYDELEIEHMIPKSRGGPDNIRNCQLACQNCNQAKGTMTDIEFRQEHARYLPEKERTPADPPIDPGLLNESPPAPVSTTTRPRRFWRSRRK